MASPMAVVGYLVLFASVGVLFLFVNLLVGRYLRPDNPNQEKQQVYECGEPTIGSSFVQFDLRFYVVALLFIIFDVEVAFFFPWATVFGKATHLMNENLPPVVQLQLCRELGAPDGSLSIGSRPAEAGLVSGGAHSHLTVDSAQRLVWVSLVDMGVFFTVLLVGFAYVWKRGDLDWVRAVSRQRSPSGRHPPPERSSEPAEPVPSTS